MIHHKINKSQMCSEKDVQTNREVFYKSLLQHCSMCSAFLVKTFEKIFAKVFSCRNITRIQLAALLKNELFYLYSLGSWPQKENSDFVEPLSVCFRWGNPLNEMFKMFHFRTSLWLLLNFKWNLPLFQLLLLLHLLCSLSFLHSLCLKRAKSLRIVHFVIHLYFLHAWTFFKPIFSNWFFIHKDLRARYSYSSSLAHSSSHFNNRRKGNSWVLL